MRYIFEIKLIEIPTNVYFQNIYFFQAIQKATALQKELDKHKSGQHLHCLQRSRINELESLPLHHLQQLQLQLRLDLEALDKVSYFIVILFNILCHELNMFEVCV